MTLPPDTVESTLILSRILRSCRARRQPRWNAMARAPPPDKASAMKGSGSATVVGSLEDARRGDREVGGAAQDQHQEAAPKERLFVLQQFLHCSEIGRTRYGQALGMRVPHPDETYR